MEHVRQPSPPAPAFLEPDPVIEFYKRGIDLTLVDQSLRMTAQERMDAMVALPRRSSGPAARRGCRHDH